MAALFTLASWSKLQGSHDDHWSDRVSHLWTAGALVVFSTLVTSVQFVGQPIECWCPAYFTSSFISYTKNLCWISNTYYVPEDDSIPVSIKERQSQEISYYRWVPIILLFQAFMFKFPNIVWKMLNNTGGVNIDRLVELADKTQFCKPEEKDKITNQVTKYIDSWLKAHRHYHYNLVVRIRQKFGNVFCFWFAQREGKFLVGFYLFIKLLFVLNVIFQFFVLNKFLSMDYSLYGYEVINKLMTEGEFKDSPRFPRVTLCDFEIRQLQNIQRYTVQCVLPVNLFNEKIFIILWFWYIFVTVVAGMSYISSLFTVLIGRKRSNYVKKFLKLRDSIKNEEDSKLVKKFADQYLRDDGVFVLHVIAKNSSNVVITDIVGSLWNLYKENMVSVAPKLGSRRKKK